MPGAIPQSPIGLYWNMRGSIRCEQHALEIGKVGWVPIPEHEEPQRQHYQCQRCSSDENAISR